MTPDQKLRIERLEDEKRRIKMTVYPSAYQEARDVVLLALEDRQRAIFEGRI